MSDLTVVIPDQIARLPGWHVDIAGHPAQPGQTISIPAGRIPVTVRVVIALAGGVLNGYVRTVVDIPQEAQVRLFLPLDTLAASPGNS